MKKPTDTQKIQLSIAIFAILILIALVSTALIYIPRIGKIAIITKYAPFTSEIYLNGTKISNNTTNYLPTGKYDLVVKNDHFTTNTDTITITEDSKYLIGKLIAADTEGEQITTSYQKEFQEVEGIFGELASTAGQLVKQQYPILNYLPINNNFYSISFYYDEHNAPIITVKAAPEYADIAVKKLLSLKNITLTDYDITFTTTNPFITPTPSSATDPIDFIKSSFPNLISSYQISASKTIDDYFLTTIYSSNHITNDTFAHLKVILKKSGDSWVFATTPTFLLTQKNSPLTPTEVLDQANQL